MIAARVAIMPTQAAQSNPAAERSMQLVAGQAVGRQGFTE
jgi:hypothetical protein